MDLLAGRLRGHDRTKNVLVGEQGEACIVERESHTLKRVLRSTFSAETMSCAEALGSVIAMGGLLLEAWRPPEDLRNSEQKKELLIVPRQTAKVFPTLCTRKAACARPVGNSLIIELVAIS